MSENLAIRWMKRYKFFFLLGLGILILQIFLAYKSLRIPQLNIGGGSSNNFFISTNSNSNNINKNHNNNNVNNNQNQRHSNDNSVADDEYVNTSLINHHNSIKSLSASSSKTILNLDLIGFKPECEIITKEAISAIHRAKSVSCKKLIANLTCQIQSEIFYPITLPNYCPNSNYTTNKSLGCYKDEKEYRLLSGYYTNFKLNNSPKKCIQMCLQSGFPYAGVQYSTECFCGNEKPPASSKLPDPNCNMKCPGEPKQACGGYFTINIYETGIAKFVPQITETTAPSNVEPVRIAFLLTLNGRALRQVHRLIKALYSSNHVFYIHVDARQDYLFRELTRLEEKFPNIRLAPKRFSTIWGGASLLTMLLQCMEDLLKSNWKWDFVINLSESDFPIKTPNKLVKFLTANKGKNFVKSHGRETQRFIQKQGLDKTFVECDTHMWRIGDRELPNGIQIDGGSDWIALSKNFVEYVTRYKDNDDDDDLLKGLITIFSHTLLPAESFFHTVLRNSKYCGTYVDNNLHITNWKRRLGCKCQYKHVVDWCGCSPNDFKPDDWNRIQSTESKMLFFARKFEPIINQAIILQLEEWLFGPYTNDYVNLNSYWQNLYHYMDKSPQPDSAALTISHSLMRLNGKLKGFTPDLLKEITSYKSNDDYKGFIIRYIGKFSNISCELETRIRPSQTWQTVRNSNFAKRIRNFEVSSEYDQKEQISRNFAQFLGPFTDVVLTFRFIGSKQSESHSYNLTVLWIDPTGNLQDFNEIHVEDAHSDSINFSKANLKHPLIPGIWTVKLIGRSNLFAQTRFLIVPLNYENHKPIKESRAKIINLGTPHTDITYPNEWSQYLPSASNAQILQDRAEINSKRYGNNLSEWIDNLVNKFFYIRETCLVDIIVNNSFSNQTITTNDGKKITKCNETSWSTLSPDPKSDVYALLKRR